MRISLDFCKTRTKIPYELTVMIKVNFIAPLGGEWISQNGGFHSDTGYAAFLIEDPVSYSQTF